MGTRETTRGGRGFAFLLGMLVAGGIAWFSYQAGQRSTEPDARDVAQEPGAASDARPDAGAGASSIGPLGPEPTSSGLPAAEAPGAAGARYVGTWLARGAFAPPVDANPLHVDATPLERIVVATLRADGTALLRTFAATAAQHVGAIGAPRGNETLLRGTWRRLSGRRGVLMTLAGRVAPVIHGGRGNEGVDAQGVLRMYKPVPFLVERIHGVLIDAPSGALALEVDVPETIMSRAIAVRATLKPYRGPLPKTP